MTRKKVIQGILSAGGISLAALFLFSISTTEMSETNRDSRKAQKLMSLIEDAGVPTSDKKIEKKDTTAVLPANPSHEDIITKKNNSDVPTPDSVVLEKTQNFFANIPRIHTLEGKTDADVHNIPIEAQQAGEALAMMRDFFVKNPQPIEIETAFYLDCSQQKDFFESVKAICAARVGELYTKKTGRKISPLVFDKRTAVLKEKVNL